MSLVISPFYANISLLYPLANGTLAVAVVPGCSVKNVFINILRNSHENTFVGVSFIMKLQEPKVCNFIKKETSSQMFSCEFCEIFKNTIVFRTPSEIIQTVDKYLFQVNYGNSRATLMYHVVQVFYCNNEQVNAQSTKVLAQSCSVKKLFQKIRKTPKKPLQSCRL